MARPAWRLAAVTALALGACAAPFVLSGYRTFQLEGLLVYAVALLGLNLLTGYNGQISLGHGAFFALGAYVAAILIDHFAVPYPWTIPAAGAACLGAGFLFGLPALRLEPLYLALATLALGICTPQLLKYKRLDPWTGGSQGIVLTKPGPPGWLHLTSDQWLYFFALAVAAVMFALAVNLLRGRIGRALIAIRDHPIAASAMGVDVGLVKSLTFGVSAMFTGIAGALSAITIQFVAPDSFGSLLSISLLVGVVIGGSASIEGALFGALFLEFVPTFASDLSKALPWAIYGALLIAGAYLMPTGVAGVLRTVAVRIRAVRATRARKSQLTSA